MKAKTKLNKLLSLLLTLTMVLGMLPAMSLTAFAAEPGISLSGGDSDGIGTGWSYVESTKTLTLNNYSGGYIQGTGFGTLNLVLEGTSTITVEDANAKGIALDTNQSLKISGSGSLTINATGGSNLIYGIECYQFTMTSGTVTINANSSKMVYGVNANSSLSVTGGKLTANIIGTSDGRGLYCKTGKLTVDSGAEVDVTVTNNGSSIMYGIYNNAYAEDVTDNGDIELAGTVTITRDGGSTGSGNVYGIANSSSNRNTDGVISITGGSVTVTNAHYGIVAFTKGHAAAFADVDISGGTVNVTSTTSGSLGIVSWNNGVTISGGTVTANTAYAALWLADSDSANKTGLVKITDDAKVSLTSTGYKALIVQGDEFKTSTRVHQINLTSGGSVTVKSTSSDESYYAFPVQGYFSLDSSTKITEGSLSSTADGINENGGRLFQADSTTKQVVVAYSTLYTGASAVSVNGHSFASDKLYYKNVGEDTTNDSTDYNAHYDPATGVLELKNYNSGPIIIGGSNAYDVTVKLTGTNTVTTSAPKEGGGNVRVGINITNADNVTFIGDGTLTVNTNAGSGLTQVFGIWLDRSVPADENLTFQSGKVTVNVTAADTAAQVFGVSTARNSMGGPITVAEGAELNVTLSSASIGLANGLLSKGDITLNGTTAITLTYTGSGSPNASNWTSVSGFFGDNKLNVGANAAITVDMPDTYSLTNGMSSAYYAAKSDSQIGNGDWTNSTASEQYFENDSFLVTQSAPNGSLYADYKYEVITPLTFEDKADYDIPAGTKDDSYTAAIALTATGGSGEYRYEFEGTKPSDLFINAENKLVYTRASVCGAATATVKVTDKGGISKSITIDIGAVTATSPGTGTVPHIENKEVPVGTEVFIPWPEGATTYQRFEGSTQVGSGDKSGYPDGMYIPAQSTAVTKTYKFRVSFSGEWVESNEFTVTWTATPIPAATVDAVTVSGTTGTAIAATEVNITLTNDTFASSLSGDWITNLPAGLRQSVTRTDDTHAKITVTGTPTAVSTAAMTIVIPNAQLVTSDTDLTVTANANAKFNISAPATYNVTINAGANMTLASGSANQSGLSGAMTDTVYTAADGYYFPTDYAVEAVNGISVMRNSYTQITVSGTPTANTTITLTQATAKTKATAPTGVTGVACTTSANNDGKLQNVTAAMEYKKSDASNWTDCGGTEVTGLADGTYYVRVKATDTALASDYVEVTVAAYTATAHTHSWATEWSNDETYHWHNCTAEGCDVTENSGKDGYGAHDYTDDADTECNTCGYKRTITPSHTHSWATEWSNDETYHWHNCTAEGCDVTENSGKDGYGEHVYDDDADTTCNTCGYIRTVEPPAHTHSWATAWSNDETYHWHNCTAEGCDVTENSGKDGYGTHDYTDDTDTTCNTCDYERTVAHEHTFGAWSDEVPATCKTTGTKGHKDCTGCNKHFDADGNEITDLTIPVDPANHTGTLGGWVKTDPDKHWKEYSCCHVKVEEGTHVYTDDADTTCNTCGYIRTISAAAHTVTVNGSYAVNSGAGSYDEGDTVTIHAGSRSGYTFDGWTSDDVTIANASNKNASFVMPDDDVTVTAHWTRNAVPVTPTEPSTYTIKVEKTDNGDVTVSHKSASKGTTVTITVEPDEGYTLETLTVTDKNGDEIRVKEKNGKYTFTMPASKVYVEATFMEDNSMLNFFVDVPADAYYYDAVLWAAKNGITGGVDDTHFAPNATCTRAQAVTFLWRAAGSPAPKNSMMPFTDVPAGSYYETAVLWAVENGITKGTGATTFSPNATCSRGQIVSFLWRALGSPAAGTVNPFTDVAADSYYADAVLWAAENGITGGTSATTFSPNNDCTRAQIVTFLWRALTE